MNYLKELNAFKEWMLFHEIPACAVALWHTLMLLNNTARWIESFNAPNSVIENLSGLSVQRISEARKVLVDQDLISYEPGVKGKAPVYQMKSLVAYFEQLSPTQGQCTDQSKEACQEQSQELYQEPSRNDFRNIHKEREKEKKNRGGGERARNAYTVYEQNFGILKPIVQESFLAWCNELGDELVIEAIKHAAEKGGRSYSYLDSILKEWVQAGVKTLEQAKNYEQQKQNKRTPPLLVQQKRKNKAVLEAFRRDVQA